ncbi:MAG: DUF2795 domain-containing protein [Actinomycetota bacterium]|nr:DUF2795 domain-containing protein [Actinomycetota bacterium]
MTQQSGTHGPLKDDQLARETRGLVQGGHTTRAQEWRDPEPAGEDQPTGDQKILADDRRGTPPGMQIQDVEERSEISRFLDRAAFPGTREDLLASAEGHQATDHVRQQLAKLPEGEQFRNMQDVARALGIGVEERRT